MFKIFTFKQMAVTAFFVCIIIKNLKILEKQKKEMIYSLIIHIEIITVY